MPTQSDQLQFFFQKTTNKYWKPCVSPSSCSCNHEQRRFPYLCVYVLGTPSYYHQMENRDGWGLVGALLGPLGTSNTMFLPCLLSLSKIAFSRTALVCEMDSPSALISHGRRLKPEQKAVHLFPDGLSFVLPSIRHAIRLLGDGGFAPHASKSSHAPRTQRPLPAALPTLGSDGRLRSTYCS